MTPIPSGRLVPTATGVDLVLTRMIKGTVHDVWASVTESERTARWFGPWRGEAGSGRTIEVQMGFEEGAPWSTVRILHCTAPLLLSVETSDESGTWRLEIRLTRRDDSTELVFTQHLQETSGVPEIGPGWEYYLDALITSREHLPAPDFGDYFPAQSDYYRNEVAAHHGART